MGVFFVIVAVIVIALIISFISAPVVAVEPAEAGQRPATMGASKTETMVTTEMAVIGSTAMAVEVATVVEEAISRKTTPNRYALKRTTEMLTQRGSSSLP